MTEPTPDLPQDPSDDPAPPRHVAQGRSHLAPATARHAAAEPADTDDESAPGATEAIEVTDLALTKRRPVFGPVSFELPHAGVGLIIGPTGAGRSSVLLAVTGRMRGVTGTVRIGDALTPAERRAVTSVARIADLIDIEDQLTLAESVTERCLFDAVAAPDGEARYAEAADILGLDAATGMLVADLAPLPRLLFTLAVAMVRPARLVVLDDVDRSLAPSDQRAFYVAALQLSAQTGTALLFSSRDAAPAPSTIHRVLLQRPAAPAEDS